MTNREIKEHLCSKLRALVQEYDFERLKNMCLIGPYDFKTISNVKYIHAPTLGETTLANVDFKVARFWEELD